MIKDEGFAMSQDYWITDDTMALRNKENGCPLFFNAS